MVVDDDDLVVGVACQSRQGFDATLERLRAVATPNNDRNFSRLQQLASDTECVGAPVYSNVSRLAATRQVSFNCTLRGLELARFLPDADRAGTFTSAPMI